MPGPYGAARENGHKKSHRRWETVESIFLYLLVSLISACVSLRSLGVSASLTVGILISKFSNVTITFHSDFSDSALDFSQSENRTSIYFLIANAEFINSCTRCTSSLYFCGEAFRDCICLINLSLSCHNSHTSFSDNLLLLSLINIARQSGDQQGGQDGQDDENDDELDESEALLILSSFYEFSRTL